MTAKTHKSLYAEVVAITGTYLGPAADRFITRQIQNHLHKEATDLSPQDLVKLIDWMRVALSMTTEDQQLVEEYVRRLQDLTKPTRRSTAK